MLIRDLIFYFFAISILLAFTIKGSIKLWESICFSCLYLVYVTTAIVQDRLRAKEEIRKDILTLAVTHEELADQIAKDIEIETFFPSEDMRTSLNADLETQSEVGQGDNTEIEHSARPSL
jgi:Ca2+/Na+ antiporter